ncbi:SMI1/KNR4 family protein [Terrabacter sp. Root85]|uniref:SMI1/KNR4 family protein n=1 Tax=Terrabacter sp. Root85 TaxID=1736603 RepID=UPI000A4254F8|nr:SMI1/KNR4 family protein [Terrabacter sp. Root85]
MEGFERFGPARPLATAEEVSATESAVGRPLPTSLREMLLTVRNGDRVRANQLTRHPEVGVDNFLRAGLEGTDTILSRCEELGGELPAWFLPFADCDGGNLLGMDGEGRIFFWDHEEPDPNQAVTLVAPSLSALEDDVREVVVAPEDVSYTGWVNPDFAETLRKLREEA